MRSFCWPIVVCLVVGCSLQAQNTAGGNPHANEMKGMPPRATPTDYPAHAQAGNITIAAEFTGHSVPRTDDPLSTDDFVVVETGVFGAAGAHVTLSPGDFSLRINDKKPVASQPFIVVASSVKDPEWVPPDQPKAKAKTSFGGGGGGNDTATLPPKVPIELRRAMTQYIDKNSLPEGDRSLPVAGLLFFQYRGKTQNIHSLELMYSGPAGKATLPLQP
jgi:hypothetical protein